ncbi:MAG: hypothetical protein CL940_09260 [Deltaproteobacteria bacterium]|nr:hypothetical protein [Deltaproteobacteria bacterium]|tara:strand:- start:161 stop:640 length:480 start_codon:yes stop_codon:yes gene_type:complete
MIRHTFILLAAMSTLVFVSLGSGEDAGAESVTPSDSLAENKDTSKEFTTKVASAKIKRGAEGLATLTIVAGKGFKWNKEYPAKVTFEGAPKHVTLAKTQLKQFGGDFKTSDKQAAVAIKMTGTAAGKETLKAKAKFSVCNDTTCVIREANIDVAVNVTK